MESAIKIPTVQRPSDKRAYLAGGGATAALVAAAVIVFLGIAAFVGFDGLPFGSDDAVDTTVNLTSDAPQAAAAAGPTADSVAATPATPDAAATAEIIAALPPGVLATLTTGSGTADGPGPGPGPGPLPEAPTPGTLGNLVSGLDNTTSGLGLNLGLSDLTDDLTKPLDNSLNNTVNGIGGALGSPKLGENVNKTANGLTDRLLGPGGLLGAK